MVKYIFKKISHFKNKKKQLRYLMVKFFDVGPELYFKKDQMLYHNPLNMMTCGARKL
jgi:regulator of sirC expression with transglutaminase-like and TPR domain